MRTETGPVFTRLSIALMLGVGVLAFAAMLVLGAYAPDLKSGNDGGSHALANGATGFSGLVRMAEATGHAVVISRDPGAFTTDDLLVLTPPEGATDMSAALTERDARPTLIVLPKWNTVGDRRHRGWVRRAGLRWVGDPQQVLYPRDRLTVKRAPSGGRPLVSRAGGEWGMRFAAPRPLQTFAGPGVAPLITDAAGNIVVGQLRDRQAWVLSDPDLIDNRGMRTLAGAKAGVELLDYLTAGDSRRIVFDVTLNGLGRQRSPLKLAFSAPFLAVTLTLAATLLLVGIRALTRFGPVAVPERAIAFGKAALIDNAAALVARAGRAQRFGGRYAEVVREQTSSRLPAQRAERFATLAQTAEQATTRGDLVSAAQALDDWRRETGG